MASRVFTVGLQLPGDAAEYIPFRSDRSLFDGDVILFCPTFEEYDSVESYAGLPLVTEHDSPTLIHDIAHWRSEIATAIDSGKVVFVCLARPVPVYYHTGGRTHSGTGRSRVTTRDVAAKNSYDAIPITLEGLTPRQGNEISVMGELGPLAAYWGEFGSTSAYEVYFDPDEKIRPLLGTKKREEVVGALARTKGGGALVLLPPVVWDEDALTYSRGKSVYWRKEGVSLGKRLVAALVGASDALRKSGKRSPTPEWVLGADYTLKEEEEIKKDIAKTDNQLEQLAQRRKDLDQRLKDSRLLYGLLFESGKPLEEAILRALSLLGFEAAGYQDGESEFDAVFTAPEGRFLGEAEGKDSKAVNIDKISQLERNLQEDFAREEVESYAKGALFGNAFRFTPVAERPAFFTAKCESAAARLHAALVRTPDLFPAARYLSEHEDPAFAAACRQAIFDADGTLVQFPVVPGVGAGVA